MVEPVLTLLVASALPWSADAPRRPEFQATLVQAVRVIRESGARVESGPDAEPTVIDVPYYYSDFTPVTVRPWPEWVTYDWRSPVVLDVP